jgi:molecular chaperone HtpG
LLPDGHSPFGPGRPEQNENITLLQDNDLGSRWCSLTDCVSALRENQTAISYVAGPDLARIEASPQLGRFRARGIEVLLLSDRVDSFSVIGADDEGKPFKSVTQGAADLALVPLVDTTARTATAASDVVKSFVDTVKTVLSEQVSECVSPSN